jgi:putative ABC transport system permease protein
MLRRSPGVTAAAVVALALGIGANTAIFSVVDGVLLRPLPFPDSHALYAVHTGSARFGRYNGPFSWPEYEDLVAQNRTFESVGGWTNGDANLTGAATPERVLVRAVTPSLLPTLRVAPIRGRNFLPEETFHGRDHVAILDYGLWQRQFSGAADVIGQSLRLDTVDYEIIGVLPRGFRLESHVDVWLPLATDDPGMKVRNAHFLRVVGRERPGVTAAAMTSDLGAIAQYETNTFPDMFPPSYGFGIRARPYIDEVVGDVRLALFVLLGAVAFVLLIACANVANLMLARAATRQREMAIRTALGAGRRRLVRQLLTESLVLSIIGGALGALFAAWGIDVLVGMSPDSLPRVGEVALDVRVLCFTALIALLTGIAFGLAPAISASRPDLHDSLKDGRRGTTSGRGRLRKALVVAEVALSLVLLVGAGLMVRSFLRLRQVDPGFRPDHALMMRVSLPVPNSEISEADRDRFVRFFTDATAGLRTLPGVSAAGGATALPLDGNSPDRLFDIEGYTPDASAERPDAQNREVTPGWFAAMGIPLLQGRDLAASDDRDAPRVVVVNDSFAKKFFPKGDAIGKRIRLGKLTKEFPWGTIVGIVGNVRGYGLDEQYEAEMYWPTAQSRNTSAMSLVVRTGGDPGALAVAARGAIAEIDPAQPVFDVQSLEQLVASSLGQRRFMLTVMMLFGLVALVLAAVGIYGVMSYTVAQRTQEIGIRVALGAQPASVLGMVIRDGMTLVGIGLALGTAAALGLARVASSLLYGVSSTDVVTYAVIAGVLAAVALLAIVLPARRAMRVDPMQALRSD